MPPDAQRRQDFGPSAICSTAASSPLPATGMASWLRRLIEDSNLPGEIETPSGQVIQLGALKPRFRVRFHRETLLKTPQDEFSLGQAYVNGDVDIDGDMLAVLDARDRLSNRFRVRPWVRFAADLFLRPATRVNKKAITDHYALGDDFYLTFIDRRYRFYSHCIFESDDETLEQAAEHKLESMFRALDLRPGMRLLDVGTGWGGIFEYACPRGVHVTSLTLMKDSRDYVVQLLQRKQLKGEVLLQDFLTHCAAEPYDAIVIYGVIEHIPYYRHFFERAWQLLKPGGKIYIDASATKEKYSMSQFTRYYTWHGTHTFMCLQDVIQEALYSGFQIVEVKEESHDYELTMLHWATRLEQNRGSIVGRWNEELYRAFRLFLWGGCHALGTDHLQAYHVVARRGADAGPRPGRGRRFLSFLKQIA
jgi:cyclopropane fatty-acyl-phospholipid synthase-like methyltransferase